MQPTPGTVYRFDFGSRKLVPVNEGAGLPLGQRVSYGDMANQRRTFVVVSVEPGPTGFRVVTLDGEREATCSRGCIDGPGGWKLEDGRETVEEVQRLAMLADLARDRRAADLAMAHEQRRQEERDGLAFLEQRRPAWAVAALVAELHENVSDLHTDYFAHRTTRRLLLGWSRSTRDGFAEMRKAAAVAPETAELATAPATAEHREKYSGGGGYYLKNGHDDADGWAVRKLPLAEWTRRDLAQWVGADPTAYRVR